MACAQILLESVSEIAGKTADAAGTSPTGSEAERDLGTIAAAMRAEVKLLAREWPEDYPAGAMEWLVAGRVWPGALFAFAIATTMFCAPVCQSLPE